MSSNDNYRFSIANQQVTGVQEWDHGRWEQERIDRDESYQVSGNQVIKNKWDDGRQKVTTFQDANGDGIYQKVSKHYVSSSDYNDDSAYQSTKSTDDYRFSITNQQVTGVQEWDHGRWEQERIDRDESYQVSGNQVIKNEWDDGRQKVTTFQDTNGDGIYQKVSKHYVGSSDYNDTYVYHANKDASVDSLFDLIAPIDDINNLLLVNNGLQEGSNGADHFIVGGGGTFTLLDFNYQQGDRLVFDTGMGLTDHRDLAAALTGFSYQDTTLELTFGHHAQISLTGIAVSDISWDLVEVIS